MLLLRLYGMRSIKESTYFVLLQIYLLLLSSAVNCDCLNGKKNGEKWDIGNCKQCSCEGGEILCNKKCEESVEPRDYSTNLLGFKISKSISQTKGDCEHDGIRRKHNETWSEAGKHASHLAQVECMLCHCFREIVMCTIRICPPIRCSNPIREKDSCCLKCPPEKKVAAPNQGCFQSGSSFSMFSKWKVYIPFKNGNGVCLSCSCRKNKDSSFRYKCERLQCPLLACRKTVGKPGQCCGQCEAGSPRIRPSEIHDNMISKGNMLAFAGLKEVSEEKKPPIDQKEMTEPPQITTEKPKNGRSKACTLGKKTYQHGSIFIPELAKCFRCTCKHANVQCNKVVCNRIPTCEKPQHRRGLCCKTCPDLTDAEARELESKNVERITNRNSHGGCGRLNERRVQVYEYKPLNEVVSPFKSFFIFIRRKPSKEKKSEMHSFQIEKNKVSISIKQISDSSPNEPWRYLGSVKEKVMTRFYKHETELKSYTDKQKIILKLNFLKKLIVEKAGRRRVCKSIMRRDDTSSLLNVLQEVSSTSGS